MSIMFKSLATWQSVVNHHGTWSWMIIANPGKRIDREGYKNPIVLNMKSSEFTKTLKSNLIGILYKFYRNIL